MPGIAVYNASLLKQIKQMDGCTIGELKTEYLPPKQPGVIQSVTVMFDSDLKDLERYGAIEIKDGHVKYIGEPRSRIYF